MDEPENWAILRETRPSEEVCLSWGPFRRIWLINFVQYVFILAVIFAGLESTVGSSLSDWRADLPAGIALVLGLSVGLATYVTYLYRRTWNRRARSLSEPI